MKLTKLAALISAIAVIGSGFAINVYAIDKNSEYIWQRAEVPDETTVTSVTTAVTTTEESTSSETTTHETSNSSLVVSTTADTEKEMLKQQIDSLSSQLEEKGLTIDDLSITVEELQQQLVELKNNANSSNSGSSGNSGSGGSSGNSNSNGSSAQKVTEVTTVPTTTEATTTEITTASFSEPDVQGNASLVEEAKKEDTERQFITVSAKDGSVFYIVIDYDGENQNVYFLNKVDVADLNAIANPDGTTAQTKAVTVTETTVATPQEPVVEKEEKKSGNPLYIVLAVLFVGGFGAYFFFVIKPKRAALDNGDDEDGEDMELDDNAENVEQEVEIDEDKENEEE